MVNTDKSSSPIEGDVNQTETYTSLMMAVAGRRDGRAVKADMQGMGDRSLLTIPKHRKYSTPVGLHEHPASSVSKHYLTNLAPSGQIDCPSHKRLHGFTNVSVSRQPPQWGAGANLYPVAMHLLLSTISCIMSWSQGW